MGLLKKHRKTGGVERNDDWISKLMLIDYSSILYKGLSVHRDLTCKGIYTGGLVGMVDQLGSLIREHRPEHVIVCADKGPYFRKTEVFPEYKEDRKKRKDQLPEEALRDTRRLGDEFCRVADLHVWEAKGWEADDLFALAVKKYRRAYDRIIIASGDDDLYQLLEHDNVFLLKKKGIYGARHFANEYPDLTPQDWVIYNALKGSHNNYKGIAGIGPKKALEIMTDDDKLDATYAAHEQLIETGLKVCSLPLPREALPAGEDYPDVPTPRAPQYDEVEVRDYLRQYGIRPRQTLGQALTHLSGF